MGLEAGEVTKDQVLHMGGPICGLDGGHDRRYAIDPTRISTELGWRPRHSFEEDLGATVRWTLEQQGWCQRVREQGGTSGGRLGMLAGVH